LKFERKRYRTDQELDREKLRRRKLGVVVWVVHEREERN
jgi:hypothetical protein